MARIRPTNTDLIRTLSALNKPYFTVADLEKITGLTRESLYVTLNRLTKSDLLERLRKNVYILFTQTNDVEIIACQTYFPSYLSFESALAVHSIVSQIPYTLTFATTRPSKKVMIGSVAVEYSHLKKELFFGYELEEGKNIALPEKALLDQLYLVSKGMRTLTIEELDLKNISKKKLALFAKKYPGSVRELLSQVLKYSGDTPITNENHERIDWSETSG